MTLRIIAVCEAALHHGKADRLPLAQHDEGGRAIVVEPALDDLGDALAGGCQRRKHARRVGGEIGGFADRGRLPA